MNKDEKIFIAGHKGMVGSALCRVLLKNGFKNIVVSEKKDLDLCQTSSVKHFFERNKPDYVFLAAALVGGIKANQEYPAAFLFDNLMIQNNIIDQAMRNKVKKLCFLGSSCIYPKDCVQPMKEEYLMTGPLEPTNEGYAFAKIAGLKLAQYYKKQYGLNCICPMPCNLYGTNDHFDLDKSHVLSALVKRFVDAVDDKKNEVVLWGTGIAKREFLHVDDVARALLLLMEKWDSSEIINVGCGFDIPIKELAEKISRETGYNGQIIWDSTKPDGTLKKCLDVEKINKLGFKPVISLNEGIESLIQEYHSVKKGK